MSTYLKAMNLTPASLLASIMLVPCVTSGTPPWLGMVTYVARDKSSAKLGDVQAQVRIRTRNTHSAPVTARLIASLSS